ncbi:hypothetical protein AB0C29_25150 [Actinoplanes sp. NPDC048791]|uniref:hypothetical protein n=1 Tax=Actinoplanes sp. NPDC048791 TaxID=3154623 RepID=UPI0033CC19B6
MKLTDVDVQPADDRALVVRYEWEGSFPERGSVLWALYVDGEGGQSHQLGYKLVDGQHSSHFTFDFTRGRQRQVVANFDLDADARTLTARFPRPPFEGMGAVKWRAVLSLDSVDGESFVGELPG